RAAGSPRDLPSSPTRRSSDLEVELGALHQVARDDDQRAHRANDAHVSQPRNRMFHERTLPGHWPQLASDNKIRSTRRDFMRDQEDRKSTRLNSSHVKISYAVF